jgi:hypothetical protein
MFKASFGALAANLIAYVFDGIADFALGFAVAFLNFSACTVGCALAFHLSIIYRAPDVLFNRAFGLIECAFDFVFIR